MRDKSTALIAGGLIGAVAVVLTLLGNPANMGFCIACFLRDIAGALGLHRAEAVQYVRPEIGGLILGAFGMALARREFSPRGGASPATRFALGVAVMVGALMFLGCPLRMVLRLAGGDFNALLGLGGFAAGILAGVFFLRRGFSLKRTYSLSAAEGLTGPVLLVAPLMLLAAGAGFIFLSESGPGSMRAPALAALAAGLIVGALAQLARLCMVGGIRDAVLLRDWTMLLGFLGVLAAALAGNLLTGRFVPGFEGQPVAHTDGLWNFLGMAVVGWGSVLLGGCPLRQLIMTGEGNADSAVAVLGMLAGAAFCHNFGLASSAAGPTANGKLAVGLCLAVLAAVAVCHSDLVKGAKNAGKTPAHTGRDAG